MATHSSSLAWRFPWMEEPGRLQSMDWQRVRQDGALTHTHTHWLMFAKLWIPSIDSEAQVRVLTPGSHVRSKSVPGDTGLTFYS